MRERSDRASLSSEFLPILLLRSARSPLVCCASMHRAGQVYHNQGRYFIPARLIVASVMVAVFAVTLANSVGTAKIATDPTVASVDPTIREHSLPDVACRRLPTFCSLDQSPDAP